jgi:itaconate CoA-transferase
VKYAGDGSAVFLSIQNEREFARFCDIVLRNDALAADPRFSSGPSRQQNRDAMHAAIEAVFSSLSSDQVLERLENADIANARLNSMEEFWRHPQLEARGRWRKVGSPAGELMMLKPPFNLDGVEPRMDAIPAVGEHTRRILAELGYGNDEIETLVGEGAV